MWIDRIIESEAIITELNMKEVVTVLREEYDNWIKLLTEEEKRAIHKYSYNSYEKIKTRFYERLNAMLRGNYNKSDKDMLMKYATIISNAINKHRLEHDIICYRGTDVNPLIGFEIGTKFTFDQFISTSVIETRTMNKEYKQIIHIPVGSKGAYIEKLSAFPKQREFLLDKDCVYKLISVYGNVTELEVIP